MIATVPSCIMTDLLTISCRSLLVATVMLVAIRKGLVEGCGITESCDTLAGNMPSQDRSSVA